MVSVHEPGSTRLGDYLRVYLKNERETAPRAAELFLFAAARNALVREVIKPALKQPRTVVVADRFADSTTAYQGYGRRMPLSDIAVVNRLASEGLTPDLTFLLDCPPAEGLSRTESLHNPRLPLEAPASRADPEGTRRFEEQPILFHERVRSGYLKSAAKEPERWRVIDATKGAGEIAEIVWEHVRERLFGDGQVATGVD